MYFCILFYKCKAKLYEQVKFIAKFVIHIRLNSKSKYKEINSSKKISFMRQFNLIE